MILDQSLLSPANPRRRWDARLGRLLTVLLLLSLQALLGGCESVSYYSQAISGQLAVTFKRQRVEQLLASAETPVDLKARLQASAAMLDYVEQELGLVVGRRYRSYVALEQDAVLFNLVATPPLSLQAYRWCYPIAGCAPYRGYFKRTAALAAAGRYQERGLTTFVGRVPAYSTLGWFKDPLLSSFIYWSDPELMALLSHELAHSRVWVSSDVAFNEAFASFVGEQATRQWLQQHRPQQLGPYQSRERALQRFTRLQLQLKERLQALYDGNRSDDDKRTASTALYAAFRSCYRQARQSYGEGRFDRTVERLNDAALAALATYRDGVPAFAALYQQQAGQWPAFFSAVDALAAQDQDARTAALVALAASAQQQEAQAADDQYPEQIQCQALADHGVDPHLT